MAKRKKKSSRRKAPWKKSAPKKSKRTKLSGKQKKRARKRAKRAGRPYPNLVDNMAEAEKSS